MEIVPILTLLLVLVLSVFCLTALVVLTIGLVRLVAVLFSYYEKVFTTIEQKIKAQNQLLMALDQAPPPAKKEILLETKRAEPAEPLPQPEPLPAPSTAGVPLCGSCFKPLTDPPVQGYESAKAVFHTYQCPHCGAVTDVPVP